MSAPILEAEGLSKTFSGRTVLNDVSLRIDAGEVHALLGQNGSGKSTLIKILAGYHPPDPGAGLRVRGVPLRLPASPSALERVGLSFVHQDVGLADELNVMENMRVGRYQTGGGWRVSWRRERAHVRQALARFGLDVRPDDPVGRLSEIERTLVAILRSLDRIARLSSGLLVLDEPTASLPRDAVDQLFAAIQDIADRGLAVLLVTHRLDEVCAIADRVTILRDGERVATADVAGLGEDDLVELVLGRPLIALYPPPHAAGGKQALAVHGMSGAGLDSLSVSVRSGEIVGLTGLLGMGQERVPGLLFGAERAAAGSIEIGGARHDLRRMTPAKAIAAGFGLLPANRLRLGGVGAATLAENLTLPALRTQGRRLRPRQERVAAFAALARFGVTPNEPDQPLATLSGGNQQKVLLAKWFALEPRVMIMHEPTHGVDVGAKSQILGHIRDAAQAGTAFVVVSNEYEDLAHLCDRVLVFRDGKVVRELAGAALTEDAIVEHCFRQGEVTSNAA